VRKNVDQRRTAPKQGGEREVRGAGTKERHARHKTSGVLAEETRRGLRREKGSGGQRDVGGRRGGADLHALQEKDQFRVG